MFTAHLGPLYLLFLPSLFLLSLFFPFFLLSLPPSPSTAPSNSTSTTACPVRFCRTATRLVGSRGIFFPYFFFPPSLLTPSRLIPFFPKSKHFIPRPLSDERTLNCQPAALKAVGSPEYLVLPSPVTLLANAVPRVHPIPSSSKFTGAIVRATIYLAVCGLRFVVRPGSVIAVLWGSFS